MALGLSAHAHSAAPNWFEQIERCDATGKVKVEYSEETLKFPVDSPCLIGHEVPRAALAEASELRVYAYDLGKCEYQAQFDRYREDLMPAGGLVLKANMRAEIEALLPIAQWEQGVSMCFEPHHALVWFDKSGKEIASAEICFSCTGFALTLSERDQEPVEGKVRYSMIDVDFGKLRQLFKNIGVPMNLKQACKGGANGEWAESVNALCKLEAIRKNLSAAEGEKQQNDDSVYVKRCVQLPNRIQF